MARPGSLDSPSTSPSANAIGNGVDPHPRRVDPLPQLASFARKVIMNNALSHVVGTLCLMMLTVDRLVWMVYQIRNNFNLSHAARLKPSTRWSTLPLSPMSNSRTNLLPFYPVELLMSADMLPQASP